MYGIFHADGEVLLPVDVISAADRRDRFVAMSETAGVIVRRNVGSHQANATWITPTDAQHRASCWIVADLLGGRVGNQR